MHDKINDFPLRTGTRRNAWVLKYPCYKQQRLRGRGDCLLYFIYRILHECSYFIDFRDEFNKFNNTKARMLDSIYHMTNTLKSHFWRKNVIIKSLCTQRCYGRHNVSRKSINHQWFIDFIAWRYFTLRRDVI